MKLKHCTDCREPRALWKANPPLCRNCALRRQYTLKQTTDGRQARPIRAISAQRAEALKVYRKKRDRYLAEHPRCEFPGCCKKGTDLHHVKGRVGALLTDERHFCSLCRDHHSWVEEHPLEARKMGLAGSRI